MDAIRAQGLGKSFDDGATFALQDLDLTIAPGEFVAVIGHSGAGKSTFLRCLNGLVAPSRGSLQVLGREMVGLRGRAQRELRREIGFVFQQFNLVKNLSARQNVLCGRAGHVASWRALSGWYGAEDRRRASEALSSVGLVGRDEELARNLSGGQQQRVAIARALVQEPRLLLADEPMASLDPKLAEVVLEILGKANRERGITVLVNLHVLELAKRYAARIVGLRAGRVVFDGKPAQLTPAAVDEVYGA